MALGIIVRRLSSQPWTCLSDLSSVDYIDAMLKQKATRAIGWSAVDQIVRQGLFFVISVTMARLVTPEAYGIVALLGLFTGIAGVFVDGGLSSALIQKNDTTLTDESTVFWFNLAVGSIMGVALFLAAPLISRFYGIAVLLPITRIYAAQFFLGACNSVQNTLFSKHLDFKTPLKISFVSTVLSAAIGIFLAWKGYGVWALVAQSMTAALLQATLLWALSPWRPAFTFSAESYRTLFRFGGYLFISYLIDTFYQKCYTLIIGKCYGVYDLGIYNRANSTNQLPTGVLAGILERVTFPIFSQASYDSAFLRRGCRMSVRGTMFLNIPMMLGVVVVAEPLILTLFGPAWAPAIPLLRILALSGILFPLHVINLSVLKAMGYSSKFLKIELVKKIIGIALIMLGAYFGIQGMAWAVVLSSLFSFVFNAYYTGKLLGYGSFQQSRDCLPALSCGIIMAVMVSACDHAMSGPPALRLVILSSGGAITFMLIASLLRIPELAEAISLIKKHVHIRRPNTL